MKSIYQALPFVLGFGLIGCNAETSVQDNTQPDTSKTEVTKQPSEFVSKLPDSAPTMKVVISGHGEPFVISDEHGLPQGIDIDIIRAIGEEQGFKVQFHKEKWKDVMPNVASGKYDIAINGINYSDERAQEYGLSKPYFYNPSALMYMDGMEGISKIEDLKGLKDLKVQVVEKSKQYDKLKEIVSAGQLETVQASFLLFQNLTQGKADVVAMDLPILQHTSQQYPDIKVKFLPYEDESNLAANAVIVMNKDNAELIKSINTGIDKIKETGEYDEIKEKWLGTAQ